VPFIVFDPRIPKGERGRVIDRMIIQQDLAPTILDYAGIPAPGFYQGKSLHPLIVNQSPEWRDNVFLENMFGLRDNPPSYAIRTSRFKYIRFFKGDSVKNSKDKGIGVYDFSKAESNYEQLFDVEKDPRELTNLANMPEYQPVLNELRRRCMDRIKEQVDARRSYIESLKDGFVVIEPK
jgi:arylsulfatase A-like enzyme